MEIQLTSRRKLDYKEMEDVFINLGFSPIIINGVRFMRYGEGCCKMTFLENRSAFVIERVDNAGDAEKGVLEDGDWYYTDISETELLSKLKSDLIKYYMTG